MSGEISKEAVFNGENGSIFVFASVVCIQTFDIKTNGCGRIMDKLKAYLAVGLIIAGLSGFYLLPADQILLRTAICAVGVVLAIVVIGFSSYGHSFIGYARDSYKEARKVVWPSRKETWQTTAMVFAFVAILSLFMWLVDSGLAWVMYGLLLGQQ